jgi:hypothetical protein
VNQTKWEENTLVDTEPEESPSVSFSLTTTPQVPKEKRPRKDDSPSITEVSTKYFQAYIKKPKTTHATHMSGEEEPYSSTVIERRHEVVSTYSSKKKTKIAMTTQTPPRSVPLSIKNNNQMLTDNTYSQFWKQTSTTQHRVLSSFDTEKGRIHLAFLQAQLPQPKEIIDYKRSTIVFDTKLVHPADQMDFHKQTREKVFSTLAHASSTAAKLQVSLRNIHTQLKLENISSFTEDNRVKSLEDLVLKIMYDPSNVKVTEEMIKKNNVEIASLRKQLKKPPIEDSQAKEIVEAENEKEQSTPMEFIPLSAFPIKKVSTTTMPTTTIAEIPLATPLTTLEKTVDLAKSMEEMTLQGTKINRMKMEIESLQELKFSFQTRYNIERQVSEKLKQEIQQLQKQTVACKTLVEANENIWTDILKSINEIWPMVQIMFKQHDLVLKSRQAINRIRTKLGEMPLTTYKIIKFLNSKTKEELEDLKVEDRT